MAVLLKTNVGDIIVTLDPKNSPLACGYFLERCKNGNYDGAVFTSVAKGVAALAGGGEKQIEHAGCFINGEYSKGSVALDIATSQICIALDDLSWSGKLTFGKVSDITGLETLSLIDEAFCRPSSAAIVVQAATEVSDAPELTPKEAVPRDEDLAPQSFVVGLGDEVSPTDIEEGMRVAFDMTTLLIQKALPPTRILDTSVTVEEKPHVKYTDVGGCKEQIEKMRETVELPLLKHGVDLPKAVVLCHGPLGTGKTLVARAVANRTDACFISVSGSELVQKSAGEGARIVREVFQMARSKEACIVFFYEFDAIAVGARFDDEVQRTMFEITKQVEEFDGRGNVCVIMATNRLDDTVLDTGVLGHVHRRVEFVLPDLADRTQIFKIHSRTLKCQRDIRFELFARLCPKATGDDIRIVCTEAAMSAIRARRNTVTETDFLDGLTKVIKGYLAH